MIGDPLILAQKDFKDGRIIFSKMKNNKIVLIGGGSGTKKSEKALTLQQALYDYKKTTSLVISLDDYYIVHPTIRDVNRKKQGLDSVGISEINWVRLETIYDTFINKEQDLNDTLNLTRTHKYLDAIEHVAVSSMAIDVLIFEGLYANYLRKRFTDSYSVFLEGTPQQTLEFRTLRAKEQPGNKFRQQVVQKEFNVVCQLKKYADLIVPFEEIDDEK